MGAVPLEEVLFFLLTSVLVALGLTLFTALRPAGPAPGARAVIRAAKGGALGLAGGPVRGLEVPLHLPGPVGARDVAGRGGPRLVYANHTNWWDGFVLHQLGHAAGWDTYCVMEEQNLARYRFLARMGAFSIRRGEAVSSLETVRYAVGLLGQPRAAVCIFPEGEIRPLGAGPLRLDRGVELLARVGKARCVPLAIRYAFFEHERPDVLVELGAPHAPLSVQGFQAELDGRCGGWRR